MTRECIPSSRTSWGSIPQLGKDNKVRTKHEGKGKPVASNFSRKGINIPEKQKDEFSWSEEIMVPVSGFQRHFIKEIFNYMQENNSPKITHLTSSCRLGLDVHSQWQRGASGWGLCLSLWSGKLELLLDLSWILNLIQIRYFGYVWCNAAQKSGYNRIDFLPELNIDEFLRVLCAQEVTRLTVQHTLGASQPWWGNVPSAI